ncbi:MAG: hypothetical protein HC814_04495 [Rhodobacteraceae bacterium]|nr:hypothetical protein [Paracoccaceae bacterium]
MPTVSGRALIELSMDEIEAHCGAPVLMLHRASLIEALRDGFGHGGLHLGHELAHVDQHDGRVRATFTNGAVNDPSPEPKKAVAE